MNKIQKGYLHIAMLSKNANAYNTPEMHQIKTPPKLLHVISRIPPGVLITRARLWQRLQLDVVLCCSIVQAAHFVFAYF